jgi:hypothetical protein
MLWGHVTRLVHVSAPTGHFVVEGLVIGNSPVMRSHSSFRSRHGSV